jgi:hypothetical protein
MTRARSTCNSPVDAEQQAAITAAGCLGSSNALEHCFCIRPLCHAVLWPCLAQQHCNTVNATCTCACPLDHVDESASQLCSHHVTQTYLWCRSELEIYHVVGRKVLNYLHSNMTHAGTHAHAHAVSAQDIFKPYFCVTKPHACSSPAHLLCNACDGFVMCSKLVNQRKEIEAFRQCLVACTQCNTSGRCTPRTAADEHAIYT